MAFNTNAAAASSNNQANDQWKAQAFLNFFVTRTDGTKLKVGAIPLKEATKVGKAMITRLKEEGALQAFMDALTVDFQLVDDGQPSNVGF